MNELTNETSLIGHHMSLLTISLTHLVLNKNSREILLDRRKSDDFGGVFLEYDWPDKILDNFLAVTFSFLAQKLFGILSD